MEEQLKMATKSIRYERFKREQLPLGDHIPDPLMQCILSYEDIGEYEIPLESQDDGRAAAAEADCGPTSDRCTTKEAD